MTETSPRRFQGLFTDLDGTALSIRSNTGPSPVVAAAIAQAAKIIVVSAATGRPYSMCRHIIKELGLSSPCIVAGGSQIVDPVTDEIVWEQILSQDTISKVKELCPTYHYEEDNGSLLTSVDVGPAFKGSPQMMVFMFLAESEAERLYQILKVVPEINLIKVQSGPSEKWEVHITHIGASKRHALEVLLGLLELDAQDVIGIGDSQNDLPLFEACGFKVAMGNATQELKIKADYIAPTVDDDGLAHVIEKFILSVKK